jgi:hypothetical protein
MSTAMDMLATGIVGSSVFYLVYSKAIARAIGKG